MSLHELDWAMNGSPAKGIDQSVLQVIADNAEPEGHTAAVSNQHIVNRTGLDLSTVKRSIKRLEEMGCLSVRRGSGRGNKSVFTLHVPPDY